MIFDHEYLEYRGLITRVERILSALTNLTECQDWQVERLARLRKQMDHLSVLAGKLAEDLQVKLLDEGR